MWPVDDGSVMPTTLWLCSYLVAASNKTGNAMSSTPAQQKKLVLPRTTHVLTSAGVLAIHGATHFKAQPMDAGTELHTTPHVGVLNTGRS